MASESSGCLPSVDSLRQWFELRVVSKSCCSRHKKVKKNARIAAHFSFDLSLLMVKTSD